MVWQDISLSSKLVLDYKTWTCKGSKIQIQLTQCLQKPKYSVYWEPLGGDTQRTGL